MEPGDKIPFFCLKDSNENEICIKDFINKWLILYIYPKDNTQGCTREALDFTEKLDAFHSLGAEVIGISPDSPKKHRNFTEKYNLKIILLSDEEKQVIKLLGAWGKKKSYGREYEGVIRTTYLISPGGKIEAIWKKVKVKGHAEEVLSKLSELKKQ